MRRKSKYECAGTPRLLVLVVGDPYNKVVEGAFRFYNIVYYIITSPCDMYPGLNVKMHGDHRLNMHSSALEKFNTGANPT